MPSVGDYIQFKDFQTMTNVPGEILNVYTMEVITMTTPNAFQNIFEAVGASFYDVFMDAALDMQSSSVQHVRLEMNNLSDFETDFAIYTPELAIPGHYGNAPSTSSLAWSFQLVRTTRVTRHGSKRLAGVPEAAIENNIPNLDIRGTAVLVEEDWTGDIVFNSGVDAFMTCRLVIPKTPAISGELPTVFNPVNSVVFRGCGTQNTRKNLRAS